MRSVEHLHGLLWDAVGTINANFELVGLAVVGLFMLSMVVALTCFGRVFPGGKPLEDPAKQHLLRYVQAASFIDRSGV